MNLFWWQEPCQALDHVALQKATQRQQRALKPSGGLGQLEPVLIRLAGMQGREKPRLDQICMSVFIADHGVAEAGISAAPQSLTGVLLRSTVEGGALSVLARQLNASLEVIDLGTAGPVGTIEGVRHLQIGAGTLNFLHDDAMTPAQCLIALASGRESARRAVGQDLFIGGGLGVGSTTAATALACAVLGHPATLLVGPGCGLDETGVLHKQTVIDAALERHAVVRDSPLGLLQSLGGFEIAALVGAYLECAQQGVPVLVDGFVSSVAALLAVRLNPRCRPWLLFAQLSAEPGHRLVLEALQADPLLQLDLSMGDGSGAALAVPMLQAACRLHAEMISLEDALGRAMASDVTGPSAAGRAALRAVR